MSERKSLVASLAASSKPLLKFTGDKARLAPEGLELIRSIPGLIYPVILMGDGRAGKSYLASRVLDLEEAFISSDSAEPVTEGIDCVVCPMGRLLADSTPSTVADSEDEEPMHILVLDCEGGNNAMAAIRTLVNVFGIVIGTEVVFVAGGAFSEAALQNLGASLAARSLIKLDEGSQLSEQKLVFVVNKNTLKYNADTLDRALDQTGDKGREENRKLVRASFPDRKFFSIPLMGMPTFEDQVQNLRNAILGDRRPLTMGGAVVRSEQLASLLSVIVEEMQTMNEVSFPSMSRCVIMDGFLKPLAEKLYKNAEKHIPTMEDYDPDLDEKDPRRGTLSSFDKQVAHITDKRLVKEARDSLEERLDLAWDHARDLNNAFGMQAKETKQETREIEGAKRKVPVGGKGLLARVQLMQQIVKIESRTVVVRKRGDQEATPWTESNSPSLRIIESAFQNFSTKVPILQAKLMKRTPSIVKIVLTLGAGGFQERNCVVKEGHFVWWDADRVKAQDEQVSGAINFLINKATVVEDRSNAHLFSIKSASPTGWADSSSFSGGQNRELVFSAEQSQKTRAQWIEAIRKNIEFANLAAQQLGIDRVMAEVGTSIPTLGQALWGAQ